MHNIADFFGFIIKLYYLKMSNKEFKNFSNI